MPLHEFGGEDRLTWRFAVSAGVPEFRESPGARVDPPAAWVQAIVAVGRDLRCFRYGREENPDRLVWELSIGSGEDVRIGWNEVEGIGGFGFCDGTEVMVAGSSFAEVARCVADIAQTELAGDFVQWPSQGWHLLQARLVEGVAVWFDGDTDQVVAPIGALCDAAW